MRVPSPRSGDPDAGNVGAATADHGQPALWEKPRSLARCFVPSLLLFLPDLVEDGAADGEAPALTGLPVSSRGETDVNGHVRWWPGHLIGGQEVACPLWSEQRGGWAVSRGIVVKAGP